MDQPISIPGEIPVEIPKPKLEEPKNRVNVWLKSLSSLALYLVVGYFFFRSNWTLVLVLTAVVIFHELGHFFAMKYYKYQDLGMFFIPLMGAYVSGKKQEVSQKQSAIILLAGPLPGIILGLLFHFYADYQDNYFLEKVSWILVFLNLLNLLPVYPLDGGQLLHRMFLDEYNILGKIFVIASAGLMTWIAISSNFYLLLFFPVMMISRMVGDVQHERIGRKVESEGLDLMKSYEELTPEEYWKIRNVVIKQYPQFKDVPAAPPYEISPKEEQIAATIQGLLQRSIIQDLPLAGKFLIIIIWIACFGAPLFLDISMSSFF